MMVRLKAPLFLSSCPSSSGRGLDCPFQTQRVTMETKGGEGRKIHGTRQIRDGEDSAGGKMPTHWARGPVFSVAQGSKLCQGGHPGQICGQ